MVLRRVRGMLNGASRIDGTCWIRGTGWVSTTSLITGIRLIRLVGRATSGQQFRDDLGSEPDESKQKETEFGPIESWFSASAPSLFHGWLGIAWRWFKARCVCCEMSRHEMMSLFLKGMCAMQGLCRSASGLTKVIR